MAFFRKASSILRQTASKHINQEIAASKPSIFQVIRCMSSSKVFVGGLSYSTDDTSLREAFSRYGDVAEVRVIQDRETGRSRGFGFVTYATAEEASAAIQALDGQELHGRRVKVNYANDRPRSYGGGGDGFGNSGSFGYGSGDYGGGGNTYGGQGGFGNYTAAAGGGYAAGGGDSYASSGGNYGNYAASGGDSYASPGGSNYASPGGNHGNYATSGDSYASGGNYASGGFNASGGDNYPSGGHSTTSGGSYDMGGNHASGNNYEIGTTSQSFSAADGGGSHNYTTSAPAGDSNIPGADGAYSQHDPANGGFRDDDDEPGDFANKSA